MSGGWGCPFEENGNCVKRELPCDPGEKGCVLHGRFKLSEKKQSSSGTSEEDGNCGNDKSAKGESK